MKNRGFTLIELVAVVIILGIIALVTTPIVIGVLNTSKESLSSEQKLAIENGARAWGIKRLVLNDEVPSREFVTIKELQEDGAIENKILSNLNLTEDELDVAGVCIFYKDSQFVYEYARRQADCKN